MSRPQSGVRSRPQSGVSSKGMKYPRGDVVSYEDVLVAQYLEDLRKAPQYNNNGMPSNTSPYMQKLANTHIVPTPHNVGEVLRQRRARPQSALVNFRPHSAKPKMDPRFIADPDMYDPATPRSGYTDSRKQRRRPVSAPAFRRPLSATYGSSRPSSAKSSAYSVYSSKYSMGSGSVFGRRVKAQYKKQPTTIVATAYKNGCRDVFTRIAAPTIKMLLELCTDKLGLPHAARRVFLADGTEVFHPEEIARDSDIYISMGESFKNAYKNAKEQTQQQRTLAWTVNGLAWSGETQRKPTKHYLSKRFRQLLEPSKRRVLVFKNSKGTEGVEIVADPDRFEDFLVACTQRLELGSYARVLYDWEGVEIKDLKDAPVLDSCLQTWTTPVLGPLWVSKGEGFSPTGVADFLNGLINYTKSKKAEAEHYETQLRHAQIEETREEVTIVAILSMSEGEIEETLAIVEKDIEDFGRALSRLKDQMKKLKESVADENETGVGYKMKYLDEYQMDHRLVGAKGIRLKVYENGRYEDESTIYFNLAQAAKGLGHDQPKLLARLLDQCSSDHNLNKQKLNTALKAVAQKLYDNMGTEITNVYELEYDQEIWLSYGEPWKNPFTFVLGVQFDKIRPIDIQGQKKAGIREQLMSEDYAGYEKAQSWEAVSGIPETTNFMTVGIDSDPMERDHITSQLDSAEIDVNADFLKCKENPDLILYVEPVVDTKKKSGSKELWPSEAQQWMISKEGSSMTIHCKYNPRLVLGVTTYRLTGTLGHPTLGRTETQVEGYLVNIQRRTNSDTQSWRFNEEGCIVSVNQPDMRLTYLGSRFGNEDTHFYNESGEGVPKGMKCYIAACNKIEGKDSKAQRWSVKQEAMQNLGQWKHTQTDNPEWNKRALSWPVDRNGDVNENYDWPMEGFLLPFGPPFKMAEKKKDDKIRIPRRLMVLRNGVRDVTKAISVVGPDLSNMRKDVSKVDKKNKKNKRQTETTTWETEAAADHGDEDLTVLKLEFILFLERCTSLINLPFAARRVYDETGKEHFSLRSFNRDQLIYVSCGEPWTDPNLSKAEQQRRYLLANLGSDVAQIRQFIALRDPDNLVLEVETLSPGAKIIINQSALPEPEPQQNGEATEANGEAKEEGEVEGAEQDKKGTAHQVSHQKADERYDKRKRPWERTGETAEGTDDERPVRPRTGKGQRTKRSRNQMLQLQKFTFEEAEGYISCVSDPSLVLGVEEVEGNVSDVVLMRRRIDDINQRWLMDKGLIIAKANTTRVLSVIMPSGVPVDEDGLPLTYVGSEVALQNRKMTQFGRANQKWSYNTETGLIEAFVTDKWDKEVTAANKANVCTYAVVWDEKLDQPGYRVELPTKSGNKILKVCSSCARAMRGRHKLERIAGNVDFACVMGEAKDLGIKMIGSFQCLNGKVDLRTTEAAHTLKAWEAQLEKLREELSVRTIANKISAARVPFTVKVLAYKNGEGRMKPGELIIGSSVAGILGQCTYRLGLTAAARRLYTSDGFMILHLEDLVRWVQDNYVSQAQAQLRAQKRGQRKGKENRNMMSSLMDKVDLEESEEEDEEEEEEEEEEEQPPKTKSAEDFPIGYDVLPDRKKSDEVKGVMLVPNPAEVIERDGFLYLWNFYSVKPGKLFVQVLRPDVKNLNAFHVIEQADFDIQEAGEYSVDMTTIEGTPWFGKGMAVKKGDVIGFYCPGPLMLPYDVDLKINQAPFFYQSAKTPAVGDLITMNTWSQPGTRNYSFNAFIRPAPSSQGKDDTKAADKTENKTKSNKNDSSKDDTADETQHADQTGKKSKKKKKGPHVDLPPVELVLKYPIEVWVSCGETFKKPEKVERQLVMSMQQREERSTVAYELEKEKHVLRQMQGRRFDEMSPGQYKATMNPTYPVLIEGHWQEPTSDEQQKHHKVHQLETQMSDMKTTQRGKPRVYNLDTTKRLYSQPAMKRVLVFPNGESVARAVYIWGETIRQLLDNSTTRLNLRKTGKYLFNMGGNIVSDMAEIERDQLLCVSYTKTFQRPKDSQQSVEVKANWSRARKQYGNTATDIIVEQDKNPAIDVDPFGPSKLVDVSQGNAVEDKKESEA